MRKLLVITLMFFLTLFICTCKKNNASEENTKLQQIADDFVTWYFNFFPDDAVRQGFHDYDGRVPDRSEESLKKSIDQLNEFKDRLNEIDISVIDSTAYNQYRIINNQIRLIEFQLIETDEFRTNPMAYASGPGLHTYVLRNFKSPELRLKDIIKLEKSIPEYFANARNNLDDSLARPFIQNAIMITEGTISFLENDLPAAFKEIENDSLYKEFIIVNDSAIDEYKSYIAYLSTEKLPKAHENYAIGKQKYQKMLLGEGITLSPESILKIGLDELEKEKLVFVTTANKIDPNKSPDDVFRDLQKDHPSADSLIVAVKRNVARIKDFIIEKDLLTISSETSLNVAETPAYLRSMLIAAMNSPGCFENVAREAFYYITPPDADWNLQQKDGWLSVFNYYTTDIITIHEVYPGHYVNFTRLRNTQVPKIQKIFASYTTVEGWAHYCEKMMVDEGYGSDVDSVVALRYRLAQSAEALCRLCRLIVSVKMHCEGMTIEEATRFFMENWYQGEKPSAQEAQRGSYDPGYLFYTLGKLMMLKLREDYMKQEGKNFSVKKFHDKVLDNGVSPILFLREKLLRDKKIKAEIL